MLKGSKRTFLVGEELVPVMKKLRALEVLRYFSKLAPGTRVPFSEMPSTIAQGVKLVLGEGLLKSAVKPRLSASRLGGFDRDQHEVQGLRRYEVSRCDL